MEQMLLSDTDLQDLGHFLQDLGLSLASNCRYVLIITY
ncbi:hypothetical protein M6B38_386690 [Iris pallida]|uniref:Uncharacterized protein n=1 Tax=Iris pallida TaxID=29817 RepID=A0AAX6G310_IRIPA|nr:hypothetical protein M6B38_386690 [Iris pallida]